MVMQSPPKKLEKLSDDDLSITEESFRELEV